MRGFRFIALLVVFVLGGIKRASFAQPPAGGQQTPAPPQGRPGGDRKPFQGVGGTISAIQDNQFTVKTLDGKAVSVKLNEKTHFRKEGKDAKLGDFKVGDSVLVRGEPTSESTWVADVVVSRPNLAGGIREGPGKQFIIGEINSIEGTKLTILRADGEMQVIEVDEDTSFRKQGESITLADLKPGDHVFGRGKMKDGVFAPTILNVGEFTRAPMTAPKDSPGPR